LKTPAETRHLLDALESQHPGADTELHYRNPFELLVATILSAQSTDRRVNLVTPALFKRYPHARALAKATTDELEPQIHATGFFRAKSKALVGMARALVERHGGDVPPDMDALTDLPGVGRKTANVVLGHALGVPGLPVDRHVLRVANRIGLAGSDDPEAVEHQLCSVLPKARWTRASDTLILHGRRICRPRPLCDECAVQADCDYHGRLGLDDRHQPPARKRFGQHFLEPAWAAKVVRAIDPQPGESFLEIGPGHGALTRPLAARAAAVVAFEIDRDLVAELKAAAIPHLSIVEGDFLKATPEIVRIRTAGLSGRLRAAGNLPYNVASPILFKLVELYRAGIPLLDATVMLQREVAARLLAGPGTREYGILSVLIGLNADVDRVLALPPGAFRPAPKVHSTVVRLRFRPSLTAPRDLTGFETLTQAVFSRRRKTLANALLAFPVTKLLPPSVALERAGLDGRRRPETLEIGELVRLSDVFAGAAHEAGSQAAPVQSGRGPARRGNARKGRRAR
jgi:endonuclease III/ribosomal RNA small subunit methyltransferase A